MKPSGREDTAPREGKEPNRGGENSKQPSMIMIMIDFRYNIEFYFCNIDLPSPGTVIMKLGLSFYALWPLGGPADHSTVETQ